MAGSSLSALGTEPRATILRVAMALGTLSLPSQKRWLVSAEEVISTSAAMSLGPKWTAMGFLVRSMVIVPSGSR